MSIVHHSISFTIGKAATNNVVSSPISVRHFFQKPDLSRWTVPSKVVGNGKGEGSGNKLLLEYGFGPSIFNVVVVFPLK
jgi:hypothetical protein